MVEIDRYRVSFAQAEGAEPVPSQLALGEINQELRAYVWDIIYTSILKDVKHSSVGGVWPWVDGRWKAILTDKHVRMDHGFADELNLAAKVAVPQIAEVVKRGDYIRFFGFVQFVVRHRDCPSGFENAVRQALSTARAAYRLDNKTIFPVVGTEDYDVVKLAFDAVNNAAYNGAREHLRAASAQLTAGDWARSVHESVSAVESVVRMLTESNNVSDALKRLDQKRVIHPGLRLALDKLYAYSSDEQGVRHALLNQTNANVDETDALFMFGACASFVTYLIGKGRSADLIV